MEREVALGWADTSLGLVFGADLDEPADSTSELQSPSRRSVEACLSHSRQWAHACVGSTGRSDLVVVGIAQEGVSEAALRQSVCNVARRL